MGLSRYLSISFFHSFLMVFKWLLICSFFIIRLNAIDFIKSDPDFQYLGLSFWNFTEIHIGQKIEFKFIQLGVLIEIRNNPRFNQKFFPNHNWRGFGYLYYHNSHTLKKVKLNYAIGYEHESAHASMGIREATTKAHESIYDGGFRNVNLNSVNLSLSISITNKKLTVYPKIDYQFYFLSRNTPELSGSDDLAFSHGISFGMDLDFIMKGRWGFFLSIFDRVIFEGSKKINGLIYMDTDSGVVQVPLDYPVINEVNTVEAKIGIQYLMPKLKKNITVSFSYLYGNPFGFFDSRFKNSKYVFSIGLAQ